MSQRCLVCGADVVVSVGFLRAVDDKWFCTRCSAWGTISKAKSDAPKDKPEGNKP